MLMTRRTLAVAIAAVGLCFGTGCKKTSPSQHANKIVKKLRAWAKDIRTFSMKTQTLIKVGKKGPETMGSSHIWGISGRLMRVDMRLNYNAPSIKGRKFPTHTVGTIVYAKDWQWIHNRTYRKKKIIKQQIYKVNRPKLSVPGRPFDTSYNLRGLGVSEGLDFPSTILQITNMYQFKKVTKSDKGKKPFLVLHGELNMKAFRAHLLQTSHKYMSPSFREHSIKMLSRMVKYVTLHLDAKSLMPTQVGQFGEPLSYGGKNPKAKSRDMKAVVRYIELKVNHPISNKLFQFKIPKGQKVRDLTSMLLQRRAQMKQQAKLMKKKPAPKPKKRP